MTQDVHEQWNAVMPRQKQPSTTKKTLFISKWEWDVGRDLVKSYIWNIALYSIENLTFQKVDQKYLESSEMWYWRRMEKINWTDHERDEILQSPGQEHPTNNKKNEG